MINLSIVSPTSNKQISVEWIEVETSVGSFVIQSGHAPIMLILSPNKAYTIGLPDGNTESFTIEGGLLKVDRISALLILDE